MRLVLVGASLGFLAAFAVTGQLWSAGSVGGILLGALGGTFFDVVSLPVSSWIERAVLAYLAFAFAASLGVPFVVFPVLSPGLIQDHPVASGAGLVVSLVVVGVLHHWAFGLRAAAGREGEGDVPVRSPATPYRWLWMGVGVVTLAFVSLLEYARTPGLTLDFLYLAPVFAVTWVAGRWGGVAMALVAMNAHGFAAALSHEPGAGAELLLANALLLGAGLTVGALLLASVREHLLAQEKAARTDSLTGVLNRRAFLEKAGEEMSRSHRYERPLTLGFVDLDGFKQVNDELGHAVGDRVLRIVAEVLRERSRANDSVARIGGDEFALLLPETDAAAAEQALLDLRRQLMRRMKAEGWRVTFSIGAVSGMSDGGTPEVLMDGADQVLYRVKRSGKDRVVVEAHQAVS